VGLALQCCIGGLSSGFNVIQLSDRRSQFSVASNRVGHFIYGLKERIWPDFICHFHLFRGDANQSDSHGWHADTELSEISASKGPAIHSRWLKYQANEAIQPASAAIFRHLGILRSPEEVHASPAMAAGKITFGSLEFPILPDNQL
jgi:hypothetical protein